MLAPRKWVIGEGCIWSDKDVVFDVDPVPKLYTGLYRDAIGDSNVIFYENVVAQVDVGANGSARQEMGERPNSSAWSDSVGLDTCVGVDVCTGMGHGTSVRKERCGRDIERESKKGFRVWVFVRRVRAVTGDVIRELRGGPPWKGLRRWARPNTVTSPVSKMATAGMARMTATGTRVGAFSRNFRSNTATTRPRTGSLHRPCRHAPGGSWPGETPPHNRPEPGPGPKPGSGAGAPRPRRWPVRR